MSEPDDAGPLRPLSYYLAGIIGPSGKPISRTSGSEWIRVGRPVPGRPPVRLRAVRQGKYWLVRQSDWDEFVKLTTTPCAPAEGVA